jgi:hypothetical protein
MRSSEAYNLPVGDTKNCGACPPTRAGTVTHSVMLRSGYRRQSLSLDEHLCRDLMNLFVEIFFTC